MKFNTPTTTVLYTIEQAIKAYRKFCQQNISLVAKEITVDQLLILMFIEKNPELTQKSIAKLVFKDNASVTRIIELMVKRGFMKRVMNEKDRRRFKLEITKKGKATIELLTPVIEYDRSEALKGVSLAEMIQLQATLEKIINNCKTAENYEANHPTDHLLMDDTTRR